MTMLTVKQPAPYGLKSVHDLPTPPSTSRPSPPLIYQESYKPLPAIPRCHSPLSQPMSAPPRGLPPPAAMTLPPQPLPPSSGPPQQAPPPIPPGLGQGHGPAPPSSHHGHNLGQLPAPPPQWHGAEDSMRSWLAAKAEEDRRKQEEERTRQESIRLEQRRLEHSILQTSLSGGIPPPLVPLVFAGMGGHTWSPPMLEWAQQSMMAHTQGHQPPQLMPAPGTSPERRRDSQGQQLYGQYPAVPSTPGGGPGQPGGYQYPGSPRGRGHTISGPSAAPRQHGPGSNLPSLNTNVPQPGGGAHQPYPHSGAQQPESQASPIYFHHWQPPATQGDGSSNQPATPSVGEPPRKRKATSQQHPQPPPQRLRSPPFVQHGGLGNPPRGPRRGHQRQQSDLSSYASYRRSHPESLSSARGVSPTQYSGGGGGGAGAGAGAGVTAGREGIGGELEQQPRSGGGHSVGSLLSNEPSRTPRYTPTAETPRLPPPQQREGEPQSEEPTRRHRQGDSSRE